MYTPTQYSLYFINFKHIFILSLIIKQIWSLVRVDCASSLILLPARILANYRNAKWTVNLELLLGTNIHFIKWCISFPTWECSSFATAAEWEVIISSYLDINYLALHNADKHVRTTYLLLNIPKSSLMVSYFLSRVPYMILIDSLGPPWRLCLLE